MFADLAVDHVSLLVEDQSRRPCQISFDAELEYQFEIANEEHSVWRWAFGKRLFFESAEWLLVFAGAGVDDQHFDVWLAQLGLRLGQRFGLNDGWVARKWVG